MVGQHRADYQSAAGCLPDAFLSGMALRAT
jgi:hypothetical protein